MHINIVAITHDDTTPDKQVDVAVSGNLHTSRDMVAQACRFMHAAPDILYALHRAFRALCELVPTNPAFATEVAIVKDAITEIEDQP